MFLEIELKLTIDPAHTALLQRHPLLIQSNNLTPYSEQLISRYFDTPDLRLWRQGLSLRIRETENVTIQTLKTAGEQIDELHHRHEWDQPIQDVVPCIHSFEDKTIFKKLDSIIGKQALIELFNTNIKRTAWNLQIENTQIELVLDVGSVNTQRRTIPLHEIELELKQGDAKQLNKVAEILKQSIPLSLEIQSKAQRGYQLYNIDNNLSSTDS
ncbi:MAG: CYTH domain-containing protein [Rickettsiella sp.]|nr:CYTH domain-containing protein [Rickettsiella sp.]